MRAPCLHTRSFEKVASIADVLVPVVLLIAISFGYGMAYQANAGDAVPHVTELPAPKRDICDIYVSPP